MSLSSGLSSSSASCAELLWKELRRRPAEVQVGDTGTSATSPVTATADASINALRIRELCRQDPDALSGDPTNELRVHVWTALLLGCSVETMTKIDTAADSIHAAPGEQDPPLPPCREQHVLENDVVRTRADMPVLQTKEATGLMLRYLQTFCIQQKVEYKQGMNEILAPFIYLCAVPQPPRKRLALCGGLFEAMLVRYLERFYCVDTSFFLFQAFRMFQILLKYHDPQLALFLESHDFVPELYTPAWLLTLYCRTLPMDMALGVWDMLLAADDPAFVFFVGIGLLLEHKDKILMTESALIPEVISNATFHTSTDFRRTIQLSWTLYRQTPRCFLRLLRLCCVGSTDLTPSPDAVNKRRQHLQKQQQEQEERDEAGGAGAGEGGIHGDSGVAARTGKSKHDQDTRSQRGEEQQSKEKDKHFAQKLQLSQPDMALVQQSARRCLTMSAQELVSILLPNKGDKKIADSDDGQIVLLDVRSQDEINITGAGTLPKAISLEPDFLDQPAAFHKWLEHFDGTRGCRICVIDMGNSRMKSSGSASASAGSGSEGHPGDVALWRRLLLGEGDGDINANSRSKRGKSPYASDKHLDAHLKEMKATGRVSRGVDDVSARDCNDQDVREVTATTAAEDTLKPSVHFAQILLSESFKYVSVLEGGYPALVQRLMQQKGRLEPLVINHDTAKWDDYVQRSKGMLPVPISMSEKPSSSSKHSASQNHDMDFIRPKKASDMTAIDRLVYAMRFAENAKHDTAYAEMEKRLFAAQMQTHL